MRSASSTSADLKVFKRATDILLAGSLLLLLLPVLVLCALGVRVLDGPPILFSQDRVGRGGRVFRVLKFRSMRPSTGPPVTAAGDARVTGFGRVLRRWKLDELPQLWNVLKGDMSLVGPRPDVPYYVSRNAKAFGAISHLRPGITDWASLVFRDEEQLLGAHRGDADFYERVLLPRKLALARLYGRRRSWIVDGRILAATALILGGAVRLGRTMAGRRLFSHSRANLEPTDERIR